MSAWLTVLQLIVIMFLVILFGWLTRRRGYLSAETTQHLARFVVDLTLPALIFTNMLKSLTPETLRAEWYLPVLGAGVVLIGQAVGLIGARLVPEGVTRRAVVFLISMGNWVYLPLPIAMGLYGADGVRVILLMNVGATIVQWTLGVWTLQGGRPNAESLRALLRNPGLIATAVGVLVALCIPAARLLADPPADAGFALHAGGVLYAGVKMVGDLTIPLSLILIGAQLAELRVSTIWQRGAVPIVLIGRLLITPLIVAALVAGAAVLGLIIPEMPRMMTYLIAATPVAVSCSIFTARFGGDTPLAARTTFLSTLISIATVPLLFLLVALFK